MSAENRVALITGANRGLGLETARGLGKMGITVLLAARELGKAESAAAELRKDGCAHVTAVKLDVASSADHATVGALITQQFGKLDILINNAGVSLDDASFGDPKGFNTTSTVSEKTLRDTFDTNFFAPILLTQALLPLIKKSPAGRIVNLSSVLGSLTLHSDPNGRLYHLKAFAYDASKTALNAFTVHLAAELRNTPIKVNSAHPGWVKTDMGGEHADLEVSEGGRTSIQLATLPANGPTGGFFHLGEPLPW
jgi:NAD(P)-dependent dehydrogenase (short-subunit alcohol dehydrogenase family)